LLVLSAQSDGALRDLARAYQDLLRDEGQDFATICRAAAARRTHLDQRLAVVASSRSEAIERLDGFLCNQTAAQWVVGSRTATAPRVLFVYPDADGLRADLGIKLLREEPAFRASIEQCDEIYREIWRASLLDELGRQHSDVLAL